MFLIIGLGIGVIAFLFTRVARSNHQELIDAKLPFRDESRELDVGLGWFGAGLLWLISIGAIVAFFCFELPGYAAVSGGILYLVYEAFNMGY
jgi:hypothetical protein